jgi:hypothetical protein
METNEVTAKMQCVPNCLAITVTILILLGVRAFRRQSTDQLRASAAFVSRAVRELPTQEKPSSESVAQIELKPVTVSTPTLSHRMRKSATPSKFVLGYFRRLSVTDTLNTLPVNGSVAKVLSTV